MHVERHKRGGEPSLRDQIAESGETPVDSQRAALSLDLEDRRYLGREFLTWLIYHSDDENGGGHFDESDDCDEFRVVVGERVVLKALGEGTGEITARGVAPAMTPDVRYAVAGGLTVREVDLLFMRGGRGGRDTGNEQIWQAAVSAEGFDLRRVKLPALLSEDDSEQLNERIELIDQLDAMLRSAFQAFLALRLNDTWRKTELPAMRTWLARSILDEDQLRSMGDAAPGGDAAPRRGGHGKKSRQREE